MLFGNLLVDWVNLHKIRLFSFSFTVYSIQIKSTPAKAALCILEVQRVQAEQFEHKKVQNEVGLD